MSELEFFFNYVKNNMSDGCSLTMKNGNYYLKDENGLVLGKFENGSYKIYYTKNKK